MPRWAMRYSVFALALLTCIAPADAEESICQKVKTLLEQAKTNFAPEEAGGAPEPLPGAETCSLTLSLSGARAYHCAWSYPFRDGSVAAAFAGHTKMLQQCFGETVEISRDQAVNHPDFYDQRHYRMGEVAVTLSVKDKTALQKTYVFLGVHGPRATQ